MITFLGSCRYVLKEEEGQVETQHLKDFIKYPQKEILGFGTLCSCCVCCAKQSASSRFNREAFEVMAWWWAWATDIIQMS